MPGRPDLVINTGPIIALVAAGHLEVLLGRRIARLHERKVTGSLGILIKAKQQGAPIVLRTAIDRMRERGIWLSKALEQECLRLAGEV